MQVVVVDDDLVDVDADASSSKSNSNNSAVDA